MAQLLETVNRFRKLEEATAPKDDPAPVYLLDEIADMARQSPESAQAIADAVQKKLGARSPIAKFKALRIIKHLCTKGCSQFQRCMQRHSGCVRELIHFRGEPDPFKGDVPNARVREFAKEVVEVMFNATPVQQHAANTLAAQGKIQGFGSAGPEHSSGSSSGHYGGIGSSGSRSGGYGGGGGSSGFSQALPSSIPTSLAEAQRAASQLTQAASQALGEGPLAQGLASAASALGGFLQPAGYSGRLNDNSYSEPSPESSFGGGGYGSSSYAAPAMAGIDQSQALGGEDGLVADITQPGGMRVLPDAADLRRFVDTASSMDGLRIGELLREKMESPRWQVVARALAALEAVLQRGSSQACGEVAVLFQSDPGPVRAALASPQQQVQQLAAAVLKMLTGEEVALPAAGGGAKKAAAAKAAPMADLLGDDSPPAAAAAAGGSAASGIDLLGDLSEPAPAPAAPPPAAAAPAAAAPPAAGIDALLDGLGGGGAPAAAAADADMFGGLHVEAPAAGAAAAAPAPPPAAAAPAAAAAAAASSRQSAPLDDLFSGLSTNTPPASSLLGGLGAQQPQQQPQQVQQVPQQQQPVQMQPLAGLPQQFDLPGGGGSLGGPLKQHPPQVFAGVPGMQAAANGSLAQHQALGSGAGGLGGAPGQQQRWGAAPPLAAAGAAPWPAPGGHAPAQHGGHGPAGAGSLSHGGGSGAWSGHDEVSNLLRGVGHGGKYDPAFDFVGDMLKK